MVDWQLRLRAVLSKQFTTLIVVLVVLALVGGWMTYTAHATPETTIDEQTTVQWEQTGTFDHTATVTEDNSVFQTGSTLEDRSVYFSRLTPQLDGTFQTSYDARESGELDQSVSLSVVIREVDADQQGTDETVYWETSDSLAETTERAVEPGEPVSVEFAQNMRAVESQLNQIRDEIGSSPGETEVAIRASVTSEGTINGELVTETNTYTLPITISGDTYTVGSAEPTIEQYETTETAESTQPAGGIQALGGPLLFVGAIGLLIGVGRLGPKQQLSESEQLVIAYEDDRETFAEWISEIQLPEDAFDLPQASATSLGELVDFAIDTNNSVIEDPTKNGYYVRHDGYLYSYRPPAHDVDDTELTASDPDSVEEQSADSESDSPEETTSGSESDTDT